MVDDENAKMLSCLVGKHSDLDLSSKHQLLRNDNLLNHYGDNK